MLESFFYEGRVFYYKIKPIKYLHLKFNEGFFYLSIPKKTSQKLVYNFLDKNKTWLENVEKNYKKDENFYFLNKCYELNFNPSFKKTFFNKTCINSPSKRHLNAFLKMNARLIFSFYLKKYARLTNLNYTHLSIKTMKTRWGSCNHKKGYINLNIKLMQKSLKCIEYVILHELTHIKFPNHSKEFYAFIENFMPEYRQIEKEF
ncbi:M48 family metallopeptidase [Campylobacter sp. LR291e]|uniref:M48 family metallopeptidase n=1 Tax=Campylobacter sp. LR291e TaxID=2593546 RepID=UPI0012389BA6|nr:SprT family zinc-dependent metalloprotease [Campylobacter sp. LR291e]KAA6234061.1 M48 family metallopeptidase [Campylobacter sp. LR291e]